MLKVKYTSKKKKKKTRSQWACIFKVLRSKGQPKVLYPAKLPFKSEGEDVLR